MNTNDNEKLSALVDNELDRFQEKRLIDKLTDDPEMEKKWKNYHLINDVLQKNLSMPVESDLTANIHAAIEKENMAQQERSFLANALKPVAGFALAATVAVVAIVSFNGLSNTEQAGLQVAQSGERSPIIIDRIDVAQNTERNNQLQDQRMQDRLNNYLSNHARYSSGNLSGTLPYVRNVNYK